MKIDKSWYVRPESKDFPSGISAGGVVVRTENNMVLIGLINDPLYADYLLPKGRVEKGEGIKDAAKREIVEETGISKLKLVCKLGIKERLTFKKDEWRKMYYFLFVTDQIKGLQNLQEAENYTFNWFDLEKLPDFFWPEQRKLVEENKDKIKQLAKTIN